jgi:hypothetical protein
VFWQCPHRILFGRVTENRSDGNLFDERDDATSLCIEYADPKALLNLKAWQEFYGFDRHSAQATIEAEFDPETLVLSVTVRGALPRGLRAGPFALRQGRQVRRFGEALPA